MIISKVREEIKTALLKKDSDKVAVLRLILGTSQQDGDESDEALTKIIDKMIKNNAQTIALLEESNNDASSLKAENEFFKSFLPMEMTEEELIQFANGLDVVGQKSDGQAVGLVLKAAKVAGHKVSSDLVKKVVAKMRQG